MGLDKDIIKKIKRIEIVSNKIAEDLFSGDYHSIFKGNGMEFEDIREYYHGDSVKDIDWNVTARHNKAYVKKYKEERELNFFLLIDMSNSNRFGRKKEIISELGATLAFSAIKNNDKVGAMFFTDRIEKNIPLKKGKKHVLSIIENILTYEPEYTGTDIKSLLKHFYNLEKRKSIVFLISDFMDKDFDNEIKMVSARHDLILVRVMDKSGEVIPKGAVFTFQDLETGEMVTVNTSKSKLELDLKKKLPSSSVLNIYTDEDYIKSLRLFFKRRLKK